MRDTDAVPPDHEHQPLRRPSDYEYQPLRLPPDTDRRSAAAQLAIRAEFTGWELARVRLRRDGSRQIVLRRPAAPDR